MTQLRVIGAGLPRTGTTSLKGALEQLLDGRCYHMVELQTRVEEHAMLWYQALEGDDDALDQVLDGWDAAVDWPASTMWRRLADRHPDALVVLSHRGSPSAWWASADVTVWDAMRGAVDNPMIGAFNAKMRENAGFGDDWNEQSAACAHYERHHAEVVEAIDPERLLIWQPTDGWEPLCAALGVDVPDGPFFHHNDRAEFIAKSQAYKQTAPSDGDATEPGS